MTTTRKTAEKALDAQLDNLKDSERRSKNIQMDSIRADALQVLGEVRGFVKEVKKQIEKDSQADPRAVLNLAVTGFKRDLNQLIAKDEMKAKSSDPSLLGSVTKYKESVKGYDNCLLSKNYDFTKALGCAVQMKAIQARYHVLNEEMDLGSNVKSDEKKNSGVANEVIPVRSNVSNIPPKQENSDSDVKNSSSSISHSSEDLSEDFIFATFKTPDDVNPLVHDSLHDTSGIMTQLVGNDYNRQIKSLEQQKIIHQAEKKFDVKLPSLPEKNPSQTNVKSQLKDAASQEKNDEVKPSLRIGKRGH